MISKDSIDRLRDIIDIVDIVSSYIDLRKAGINYTANCPFHDEKTPSFIVSPTKGYFKCYGCGVGGDSFSFVMKYENFGFYEAVEKIAYMYNFTLQYTNKKVDSNLNEILDLVAKYYQSRLNDNVVSYLQNRGISNNLIEQYKIGYGDNNRNFLDFVKQKSINLDKLLDLGIVGKNDRGYYAKFNSRIIFPIHSASGKIVGFGGRLLDGDGAKYLNSPQSSIFNKSKLLYGYYLAKDSIFKENKIIIVEGYIDVIMLYQAGFKNAVATLGTSLTKEHLPLISRGNIDIVVCYDGDSAGINAAFRASLLLIGKGGGVVIIKNGKDPADMLKEGKSNELVTLINNPIPFIEFIIDTIISKYDITNPLNKDKALNEIKASLKDLSPLLKEEYKYYIASKLNIPIYLLKRLAIDSTKRQIINDISNSNNSVKIAEEIIIKSILEDKTLLNIALDYVSPDIFEYARNDFITMLNGNFEDENLIGIALNENIKALTLDNFLVQLRLFILHFYTRYRESIKFNKKLNYEERLKKVKKINEKIQLLKSGKLIGAIKV